MFKSFLVSRMLEYCNEHEGVKIVLPEEGTMLKFENYPRSENVPFVVYADFESYIKSLDTCEKILRGVTQNNTKNMNRLAFVVTLNVLMRRYINRRR